MVAANDQLYDLALSSAFIGTDDITQQMDADVRYAAIYNRPLSSAELSAINTKFSGTGIICTDMQLGTQSILMPPLSFILACLSLPAWQAAC